MTRVLFVAIEKWVASARFASSLVKHSAAVAAVCPAGHPLTASSRRIRCYRYDHQARIACLTRAIEEFRPDLIVPCDDAAALGLVELHDALSSRGHGSSPLAETIRHSAGDIEGLKIALSRKKLLGVAGELGLRIPQGRIVRSGREVMASLKQIGLPAVLKLDGTSGGRGVRIVRSRIQALAWFYLFGNETVRGLYDGVRAVLRLRKMPTQRPSRPVIMVQQLVRGAPATTTLAARGGTVLGILHFDVLQEIAPNSAASVVLCVRDDAMTRAARTLVHRLKLSGMLGIDYMREASTGDLYLIEINPRLTQTAHLTCGGGDLAEALLAGSEAVAEPPKTFGPVALFPNEYKRDPRSRYLQDGFHDWPADDPGLVAYCALLPEDDRVSPAIAGAPATPSS